MNPKLHLDDSDLQALCESDEGSGPLTEAQWKHFNECSDCQQRMLQQAAGDPFRQEMYQVLSTQNGANPTTWTSGELRPHLSADCQPGYASLERTVRQWLDPATHPELLGTLGRYQVESIVGWGGMGVVLQAVDTGLRRPVAIKLLLPRWADQGPARQRFLREARSAASVLHPSVIAIHGVDQKDDIPYLVMPLIVGPTLQELVQREGPLSPRQIVQIGFQVAAGLAAAHAQGVIHRDIKPGNILLDNSINRAVITDFGLARCQDDQLLTQTGWMTGTPGYMSPEQGRGEELDGRSDLFSLGAVLFYLCTGRPPFVGSSPLAVVHQITQQRAPDVRRWNEEIPDTLAQVISRLLEPTKERRFESAQQLTQFLENYLQHLQAPTQTRLPRLAGGWPKQTYRWTAAGIVTLVSIMTVGYFSNGYPSLLGWGSRQPPSLNLSESTATGALPMETLRRPSADSTIVPNPDGTKNLKDSPTLLMPQAQWEQELKQLEDDIQRLGQTLENGDPFVPSGIGAGVQGNDSQ